MNIKRTFLTFTLSCLLMPQVTQTSSDSLIENTSDTLYTKIIEFVLKKDPGVFATVALSAEVSAAVRSLTLDEISLLKKRICKYHCSCLGAYIDLFPDFATEAAYSAFLTASEPFIKNALTFIVIQDPHAGYLVFIENTHEFTCYTYTARYGMSVMSTPNHYSYFSNFVYHVLQDIQRT